MDCYPLSRFDKNPSRKSSLQHELDVTRDFLEELRVIAGTKTEIRYTEGNHEARLRKLLWGKASELQGLRNLTIPELLKLKELDISWHPGHEPYQIGQLWFTHGNKVSNQAGSTAKKLSDEIGGSVICVHCHRMGWVPTSQWDTTRDAYECGHLCDYRALEYLSSPPNWQQGWATVEIGDGYHDVNFVRVLRGNKTKIKYIYKGESI